MTDELRHQRHDERLRLLEQRQQDSSEDRIDLSDRLSSIEATVSLLAGQTRGLLDRPKPVAAIITAVGVGASIFALSLAPLAWLAIANWTATKELFRDLSATRVEVARQAEAQFWIRRELDRLNVDQDEQEDIINRLEAAYLERATIEAAP